MKSIAQLDTTKVTRLFSNLTLEGNKFNHQPGSVLGCTALVAGTTVGAGILALPAVTLPSGVVPSTLTLPGLKARGFLVQPVGLLVDVTTNE